MDEIVSFGAWLKWRRKALDLTQSELARRAGCAAVTYQKIELDERRPSKEIAARLAEALEIPPEERPEFLRVAAGELPVERLPGMSSAPAIQAARYPALPTGTVTWVFTDLANSTQLWERYPQRLSPSSGHTYT